MLPKIQCICIKQININTVYNYLKNSSKSWKFIDGKKNYGCQVSAIHIHIDQKIQSKLAGMWKEPK